MDADRFGDLLDLHGPDLRGWPAADREAAARLLDASAEARALLEEARLLDAALAAPPGPPASAELRARILAAAPPVAAGGAAVLPFRAPRRWVPVGSSALALAASLVLGFWIGAADPGGAALDLAEAEIADLLAGPVAEAFLP
jgi:ferric-dicitrate binding protein FerR (iron transport regulator)